MFCGSCGIVGGVRIADDTAAVLEIVCQKCGQEVARVRSDDACKILEDNPPRGHPAWNPPSGPAYLGMVEDCDGVWWCASMATTWDDAAAGAMAAPRRGNVHVWPAESVPVLDTYTVVVEGGNLEASALSDRLKELGYQVRAVHGFQALRGWES